MLKFFNSQPTYIIVEHDGPKPRPWVEDEESIAALSVHPGFTALMNKFATQKAMLETALKRTKHVDIRAVDNIQAGITWIEYLSNEVNRLVYKKSQVPYVVATENETAEYEKIRALIESV